MDEAERKAIKEENLRIAAGAFQRKNIVGLGARHAAFGSPVTITELDLEEDPQFVVEEPDATYEPDPLRLYGSKANTINTHESIVVLLNHLENIGKKKRSPLKKLGRVIVGALKNNSLNHDNDTGEGEGGGELPRLAATVASLQDGKTSRKSALRLKDAVHQATEQLGAEEVMKEIRARKFAYAQVVEQMLKKPKNQKYDLDHPYVKLRKKLEQMSKTGKEYYYNIEYEPQRIRFVARSTGIPLFATDYDFNYMTRIKRFQRLLLPLIIMGILLAASAVMTYRCVLWVFSYCPRCKRIQVSPLDLDLEPEWNCWRCGRKKYAIPRAIAAEPRFHKRRGGLVSRVSEMSEMFEMSEMKPKPSSRNTKMLLPGYNETNWTVLEMAAEEAFFAHSMLTDELRRLYIAMRRRITWYQLCNMIIARQRIRSLAKLVWCVIRQYRSSCLRLQLNFLREMIRNSSLVNVTACSTKKVLGVKQSKRKHLLVERLIRTVDMSLVMCDSETSEDGSSDGLSSEDSSDFVDVLRRGTNHSLGSESSLSTNLSAFRKAVGKEKPSEEEIRLDVTIMVKEALQQPYEELQRHLRLLRKKRFVKDLQAMARFDSPPKEHFIKVKVDVQEGILAGESILVEIRLIEVDCIDHFVLKRLPIPRPYVFYGTREKVEAIEAPDWPHKVFRFVLQRLRRKWDTKTVIALRNSTGSKVRLLDNLDTDIYTFLNPPRTIVAVIEKEAEVTRRKDKWRWLTPTTRRQIPMEDIPEPHVPNFNVEGMTIGSLWQRQQKQLRIEKLLKDPSDILYHSSDDFIFRGREVQSLPNTSRAQPSNNTPVIVVTHPEVTYSKSTTLPARMKEVVKPGNMGFVQGESSKVPVAGQKALEYIESRMKATGKDMFVGEARRKAANLDLVGRKHHVTSADDRHDVRFQETSSVRVLKEEWRNPKADLVGEDSTESEAETVIIKKPLTTLHASRSPASSVSSSSVKSRTFKPTRLSHNPGQQMSLHPIWSQGDERFAPKASVLMRRMTSTYELTTVHEYMSNANLHYSNLKNDNQEYIYYSVGRMLIVERKDRIIFSLARGEDSIASPSSSIRQVFSNDTNSVSYNRGTLR